MSEIRVYNGHILIKTTVLYEHEECNRQITRSGGEPDDWCCEDFQNVVWGGLVITVGFTCEKFSRVVTLIIILLADWLLPSEQDDILSFLTEKH